MIHAYEHRMDLLLHNNNNIVELHICCVAGLSAWLKK